MNRGWAKNGRKFTKKEYDNSYLKKNTGGFTYAKYSKEYDRQEKAGLNPAGKKRVKTPKKRKRRCNPYALPPPKWL